MPRQPFVTSTKPWSDEERARITGVLTRSADLAQARRRAQHEDELSQLMVEEERRQEVLPPEPEYKRLMQDLFMMDTLAIPDDDNNLLAR